MYIADRKPYEAPELFVFGEVERLTQQGDYLLSRRSSWRRVRDDDDDDGGDSDDEGGGTRPYGS